MNREQFVLLYIAYKKLYKKHELCDSVAMTHEHQDPSKHSKLNDEEINRKLISSIDDGIKNVFERLDAEIKHNDGFQRYLEEEECKIIPYASINMQANALMHRRKPNIHSAPDVKEQSKENEERSFLNCLQRNKNSKQSKSSQNKRLHSSFEDVEEVKSQHFIKR